LGRKGKARYGYLGIFTRAGFYQFAMVRWICFLLLVPLTLEGVLKGFSHYAQSVLPGGIVVSLTVYFYL